MARQGLNEYGIVGQYGDKIRVNCALLDTSMKLGTVVDIPKLKSLGRGAIKKISKMAAVHFRYVGVYHSYCNKNLPI